MATHKERRANTRQKILKVAARLFMKNGFDATTLNQILSEAGIVKGTFYQHFQSKLEVLVILGRADGAEAVRSLITKVEQGMSPLDALNAYYQVMAQWFENHPKIALDVVFSAIRQHNPQSNQPELFAHDFTKLMLDIAQQRMLVREDIDVNSQAIALGGSMTLAIIDWSHNPKKNQLQQQFSTCIELFLHGVTP